jgi:hypothetical protein
MSAEKVRRYVFTGEPGGVGVGMRGDLLVNDPAHPVAVNRTEYIEYADVAGLVEALRAAEEWMQLASCTHLEFGLDDPPITTARNELARWQS